MDEMEIDDLRNSKSSTEITNILRKFVKDNEKTFKFPELTKRFNRVLLWTTLFQHLQNDALVSTHALCLKALRILSRDQDDIENVLCERWVITLIDKSGLLEPMESAEKDPTLLVVPCKEVAIEAMKCLCNITFNSELARNVCVNTRIAHGLITRMKICKHIPYKKELMQYDMKLIFILTALIENIRLKFRHEDGAMHMINYLNEIYSESLQPSSDEASVSANSEDAPKYYFTDEDRVIVCELSKALFNLIILPNEDTPTTEKEKQQFTNLVSVLGKIMTVQTSSKSNDLDLMNNIVNLLTSIHTLFYMSLTEEIGDKQKPDHIYEGRDMTSLVILLQFLKHQLTASDERQNLYEKLSPILTVLNKCARVRVQRKFLRKAVLPHLRDVSKPPEQGDELRNHLCRLLTTPVTSVRDLVAEFLFVLCKEKVSRMVKYTGFGNAAGHLASRGLLAGGRGARYSSSSDSETEEYRRHAHALDPVVGCTRPPPADPFRGMTDEQKEYEAMKLVNLFDKMVTAGVVKPARVGADGQLQAVEHVLQLREDLPKRTMS
ncbi:synembryn [Bombyx mori]|uniref:Synembryn n=1 Tax=Bombyx mori TaxID=7091 RepID=A0A8R2M018_BOMMO|nr:synembryn [Bombyx mori]